MWHKSAQKDIVYSTQQEATSVDEVQPQQLIVENPVEFDEATTQVENQVEEIRVELPSSVKNDVPFVTQAPLAQWEDKRFQDACEEASILMAHQWVGGDKQLSNEDATTALIEIFEAQKPLFGEQTIDTSTSDTALLMEEFFGHKVSVVNNFALEEMLQVLARGQIIIVPTDGKKLKNPYFSGDGPERHMLVVTGFDNRKKRFITNDPGTKRGKEYAYSYDVLYESIRDYETGVKEPIEVQKKAMIIVGK